MANLFKHPSVFSGGYFPTELVARLRLAALCKGKTVTGFLTFLMEQWFAEEHNEQEQLITCIANRLKDHWIQEQGISNNLSFKDFKITVKKDLQKRKISTAYIQLILKILEASITVRGKK